MLIILFAVAIINNYIFIPRYGIEGAALATALSAFIFNTMKYFFIWKSFRLQPLTVHTLLTAAVIATVWCGVYFIPHLKNAVADIIYRSAIITILYLSGIYFLKIAPEFHYLINGKKQ